MDHYKSLMPGSGHDMPDEQRLDNFAPRSNLPTAWNILQFYSSNADPWVARHTIPQDGPQFPAKSAGPFPNAGVASGQYAPSRSNVQYDYTISDSGYESRAKKSAENTSLFEGMDRSQDARSVTGRLADFHPFGAVPEQFGHSPSSQREYRTPWLSQAAPQEPRPSISPSGLVCPTCKKTVKNKSELKKHDQRHNKPHKCDVEGCNRKEGFSTTNDLDRHKRSVHSADGVKFRCRMGTCSNKDKTWPRADNFRSHLKRVHNHIIEADGDLSDFMTGPPPSAVPEPRAYLEGVGSSLLDYTSYPAVTDQPLWYPQRPSADLDMSEASPVSLSVSFPNQQRPEELNGPDLALTQPRSCIVSSMNHATGPNLMSPNSQGSSGSGMTIFDSMLPSPRKAGNLSNSLAADSLNAPTEDMLAERVQEAGRLVLSPQAGSEALDSAADDNNSTSSSVIAVRDEPAPSTAGDSDDQATGNDDGDSLTLDNGEEDEGEDEEEERKSIDPPSETQPGKPDEAGILQMLQDIPPEILEKFLKDRKVQMSNKTKSSPAETQSHPCPECEKVFVRPCELKKHKKRHSKPYGCTFPKCNKQFGSKNDWKRHENSQHMQLETWKCHHLDSEASSSICGKVFSRREQFRNHLSSHHGMTDAVKLDKELQERRIGRNGDSTFWCGFCVKIVALTRDINSWTERFNHIDDHFCGKDGGPKRNISEWQYLDDSEAVEGSSAASVDNSSLDDRGVAKSEPPLPEPARAPINKNKRSAEEDISSAAKRNRG